MDAANAAPYNHAHEVAEFIPPSRVAVSDPKLNALPGVHEHKEIVDGKEVKSHALILDKADLEPNHGAFLPRLNTYLASYFMITGLHGLHVLGGCLVFIYFWLPIKGGSKLFKTNHGQLCNRIEVAGLFWHLVDLVWIFVFPIFYLL